MAHTSLERRTPIHYRRVPPLKWRTPIRSRQLLETCFLKLSRWFSTHIRHMRDLKLSSLRPRTMSISRYKLRCLQRTPLRLKSFLICFLELSKWFSTHICLMRDLQLSSLRLRTMSIIWYKLECLQYPSFNLVSLKHQRLKANRRNHL